MTEESSTISHLSVAVTTTGNTQVSGGMEFYFRCVLVVIGVAGTAANGLVLYALVASNQHKKNALIVKQNVLDLFTSCIIFVIYSLKLCNIYLAGFAGYWLCTLLLSEGLIWTGTLGSVVNLASIAIERYLKVVHHVWSKHKLKNWVIYSAVAFSWISNLTWTMAAVFSTTALTNGACYPYVHWVNETTRKFVTIWIFVSFYVIILIIFIFCYWRILVVIRRQAKVMAGHAGAGPSIAAQVQLHKIQSNIVKTMILVCALYAVSWFPSYVYILYRDLSPNPPPFFGGAYYATVIIAFLYMCTNPFVYATKFDPVREVLLRLIPCSNTAIAPQSTN